MPFAGFQPVLQLDVLKDTYFGLLCSMKCHKLRPLVYTVPFPAGFDRKQNSRLLKMIKKLKGRSVFVKIVLHGQRYSYRRRRPHITTINDSRDRALQQKLGRGLEQAMDTFYHPHVRIVVADPDSGFHALRRLFKLCHERGVNMCASVSILQLHQQWSLPTSIDGTAMVSSSRTAAPPEASRKEAATMRGTLGLEISWRRLRRRPAVERAS